MLWKPLAVLGAGLVNAAALPTLMDYAQDIAKEAIWLDLSPESPDKEDPARQMLVEIVEKSPFIKEQHVAMLADFTDASDHATAHIVTMMPSREPSSMVDGISLFFSGGMDLRDFHKRIVENPYPPGTAEASAYGGGISVDEIEAAKLGS